MDVGLALVPVDFVAREALLFAAFGFLISGIDDLAIDGLYFLYWLRRRIAGRRAPRPTLADLAASPARGRIAIFVPAWDEAAVIEPMLRTALARLDHPDYHLYVGTYPNDRATIDAVARVAAADDRVRLVIGPQPGPTTKAACLNILWHALRRAEAAAGAGGDGDGGDSDGRHAGRARAIVLHDAEDVVHPGELRLFDALIGAHWAVQLPVLPLVDRGSQLVSGHYCDEFAEAHAKQMVVRQALGAGMPLAGVGCAIAREALDAIAARRQGDPFDTASLTEDYELGLTISALGGRGTLARLREFPGGPLVAVRAYFPASLDAAVRQKARWMIGIALAGWDRIGWGRPLDLGDHWMRMRDRRAPIAVVVLAAAYLALVASALSLLLHGLTGTVPQGPLAPPLLLGVNAALLGWRLAMRALFTGAAYGAREALWSLPRAIAGNLIAMLAARRALSRYLAMLGGAAPVWDKTAHMFPAGLGRSGEG
ncbi:glycosyl transferase family protein [Sphingomonas sp. 28-62-20]|uniref:glycosyl transferase family protein n=1 Tax=Sphingomonas sp. 28-62-20 TaxID=1970433 RepID=UPI0035A91F32